MFLLSSVFIILYAAGDNDAVIPARLRKVYRPEDFDLIIENFKPEVYKFDDET